MAKFPNWLKSLFIKQLIKYVPGMADSWQDDHAPELDAVAAKLKEGGTLRDALFAYFQATENLQDNEVFAKVDEILNSVVTAIEETAQALTEEPFLAAIDQHLSNITIPDFDNNPENNISVAQLIHRVIDEIAE